MNDRYYFTHDTNAHNDPRIIELRIDYGWEFYGIYWAIVETLREQKDYTLSEKYIDILSLKLSFDKATLKQMLDKCLANGLFVFDEHGFYSNSLKRRMERAEEISRSRAEAGRKGGKAKAIAKATLEQNPSTKKKRKEKEDKRKEYTEAFDNAWKAYGLRGTKSKAFVEWNRLTEIEQEQAMESIEQYHAEEQDPQFRKHFDRYLRDRMFEAVLERKEAGVQPMQSTQRDPECGNTTNHMEIDRSSQEFKDALARLPYNQNKEVQA